MIFCFGRWNHILLEEFNAYVYIERLKRFLGSTQVYKIKDIEDWCFLHGGAGSPQIADTIETIHELGVKNVVLVGMVGGFGKDIQIGDIIIPNKILSEEGTSIHYIGQKEFAEINNQDEGLINYLKKKKFEVHEGATVTTDAIYRQTFLKEEMWRKKGCLGVDCEGSALVNVGNFYNMKSTCVYIVSDKHPMKENSKAVWSWGLTYEDRKDFAKNVIEYYILRGLEQHRLLRLSSIRNLNFESELSSNETI